VAGADSTGSGGPELQGRDPTRAALARSACRAKFVDCNDLRSMACVRIFRRSGIHVVTVQRVSHPRDTNASAALASQQQVADSLVFFLLMP